MYKVHSIITIIVIICVGLFFFPVFPHFWVKFLVFLFFSFILCFQLRLSPVPQTSPVPIPHYYRGLRNENGHGDNYFRPFSLPAPSHTEADSPASMEIVAGSLQVSNLCTVIRTGNQYGGRSVSQICPLNVLRASQPICLEWNLCFQEALLFMHLLISRSKYDHVS
jgi:hypothetical protein